MTSSREDILPPDEHPFGGHIADTWRDSRPEWPSRPVPPAGAPNVLIIVLDDLGFGQSSAYGGPVAMPAVERLD